MNSLSTAENVITRNPVITCLDGSGKSKISQVGRYENWAWDHSLYMEEEMFDLKLRVALKSGQFSKAYLIGQLPRSNKIRNKEIWGRNTVHGWTYYRIYKICRYVRFIFLLTNMYLLPSNECTRGSWIGFILWQQWKPGRVQTPWNSFYQVQYLKFNLPWAYSEVEFTV